MNNGLKIDKKLLARNTFLNLASQIIPIIIGIISVPLIIKELGIERFGILSIIFTLVSYFTVFDLGLGKATTKFTAELLENDSKNRLLETTSTLLFLSILLGIISSITLITITPLIIEYIKIPFALISETKSSIYIIAIIIPLIIVSTILKSILEGGQYFGTSSIIKSITNSFTFLIPVIAIFFYPDLKLFDIVFLMLIMWLIGISIYLLFTFKKFPLLKNYFIKNYFILNYNNVKNIFNYSKWIAISNIIWPFMLSIDRFFISAFLSISLVGFYTAPFDMITRLWIIPASFLTIFPAFSTLKSRNDNQSINALYLRALKYTLLIMGLIIIPVIIFSTEILRLWIDENFAQQSSIILKIFSLGVFAVSLSMIMDFLVKGIGRPDITTKLHLIELPFFILLLWLSIKYYGINGAAFAWTLRAVIDAILMFFITKKNLSISLKNIKNTGITRIIFVLICLSITLYSLSKILNTELLIISIISIFMVMLFLIWYYLLDNEDKSLLKVFKNY